MKKNANKGFSLVELIIVIAIMAVLVGVLAPQFIKYVESSRQSTDIDAVAEYKSAVEAYVADTSATEEVGDVTITITTTGVYASVDLSDIGLAAAAASESKFKSSGWTATTAVYDTDTYTWDFKGGSTYKNTKKPNKSFVDIFPTTTTTGGGE